MTLVKVFNERPHVTVIGASMFTILLLQIQTERFQTWLYITRFHYELCENLQLMKKAGPSAMRLQIAWVWDKWPVM